MKQDKSEETLMTFQMRSSNSWN